MDITQIIAEHQVSPDDVKRLQFWALPLADALAEDASACSRPLMVAMPGTPSSSIMVYAAFLISALAERKLSAVTIRIADFELSRAARERLAKDVHPLFIYAGQSGSQDIPELTRVLNTLKAGDLRKPLHIPRFDQLKDVRQPFSKWLVVNEIPDIVFVSGWLLGSIAQHDSELAEPLNRLENEIDPKMTWRKAANQFIKENYQPLHDLFDRWVYFKAPSFETVVKWVGENQIGLRRMAQSRGIEIADIHDLKSIVSEEYILVIERSMRNSMERSPSRSDYVLTWDANRRLTSFNRQRTH